jgi:hypothetical protein
VNGYRLQPRVGLRRLCETSCRRCTQAGSGRVAKSDLYNNPLIPFVLVAGSCRAAYCALANSMTPEKPASPTTILTRPKAASLQSRGFRTSVPSWTPSRRLWAARRARARHPSTTLQSSRWRYVVNRAPRKCCRLWPGCALASVGLPPIPPPAETPQLFSTTPVSSARGAAARSDSTPCQCRLIKLAHVLDPPKAGKTQKSGLSRESHQTVNCFDATR